MRKVHFVDFTGRKEKRRPAVGIILIIAGVIFAGLCSLFVLLAVNDFDIQRFLGVREDTGSDTSENETESIAENESLTEAGAFTDESSLNFLLLCCDDEKAVTFCDVISLSYGENTVRVKPVSTEITLEYKNAEYTLQELFGLFSAGAVCDALKTRGIEIDRKISVTETNFKMIMQKLGPVELTLTEDVSFGDDAAKYSFPAGVQEMTSDALLKYMKYACEGDKLLSLQADTIAVILGTYFTEETVNKGEDFFSVLINLVDSDISAFDFSENKDKLARFLASKPTIKAIS